MDEEIKKPSFLVYYDNEIIVLRLPDDEAGRLFKSLFPYGREEIKPNFDKSPALAMAFDILSMAIDRDKGKYVKRCEKNRENVKKRWDKTVNQSNANVYDGKQLNTKHTDRDKDRIEYQQIADMYNEICISFPRLIKLSDSRKKAIKARLKQYSKDDMSRENIKAILEAGLLVLDDIGAQVENKEWITTALFRLIDRRYTNHYPTIFTSNVRMEDLKTDPRISDRIYAVSVPVMMPEVNVKRQLADKHTKEFI